MAAVSLEWIQRPEKQHTVETKAGTLNKEVPKMHCSRGMSNS